jgi:hypothetical protein
MMKDGQMIGQIRYGYKPQYVFDAVNSILQPENWRYEIVSKEIFDFQAVVEVKLFIRVKEEWLCKGSQTGQMTIIKQNVGDAYKGAITDAIQKCFSLLSVGSDAYRGLLKKVFFGNQPQTRTSQPQSQPQLQPTNQSPPQPQYQQPPTDQQPPSVSADGLPSDLPQIAGIEYQRKNGRVIAVGNSFDKKELLKAGGFRWDGSGKEWYRDASTH